MQTERRVAANPQTKPTDSKFTAVEMIQFEVVSNHVVTTGYQ